MNYKPPFQRNNSIDALCMEIAELVGKVSLQAPLAKSPTLHRELCIKTIHSSLLIEGNSLDEKAVTAIIDGKRILAPRESWPNSKKKAYLKGKEVPEQGLGS